MIAELVYSSGTYPWLYLAWGVALLLWVVTGAGLIARLARSRPVARKRRASQSLRIVLRDALLQAPIWRQWLAGLMHVLLFGGAILIVTSFVGSHFVAPRGKPWEDSGILHLLNDVGMLLWLTGLLLAAWRRHVARRTPSGAEDVVLWGFALLIVLLAMFSYGLLTELADPAWRRQAFLSNTLASIWDGLPPGVLRSLYGWSWAVLHAALLGAALILPWGKWRHVLLSPLATVTRRQPPLACMDPLNLDGDPPYGAQKPQDLNWKQRLDLYACTRCGRCSRACPAQEAARFLNPLSILERLQEAGPSQPLAVQVDERALWDCSTCMACEDVCPVGISPLDLIADLRRERVLDAGLLPQSLQDVLVNLERRGNPWGQSTRERDLWLSALPVSILDPGAGCEVLIWVGCMGGYDERARHAVGALAEVLQKAGVHAATLGARERCCGDAARRIGNEHLWRDLATANIAVLNGYRFQRIVTLCPHCANTLGNEYPDLGARWKVSHAADYLAELLHEGRLAGILDRMAPREPVRVAYHDPCYLARGMGAMAEARELIAALPGYELVELPHHGRDTWCCGGGGGQMWLDTPGQQRLGDRRVEEILHASVAACLTACPYCATLFADGLANQPEAGKPAILDLLELWAETPPL
jgi:Fe-S oxidoreductase